MEFLGGLLRLSETNWFLVRAGHLGDVALCGVDRSAGVQHLKNGTKIWASIGSLVKPALARIAVITRKAYGHRRVQDE
jgi:hypothetical protein